MIPDRIAFRLRRWYWDQPYHIRLLFTKLPEWLFAAAFGFTLAWLAAQGF